MKRVLLLVLLVGTMLLVKLLSGDPSAAVGLDSLTFAAIGFVILAAHALAELADSVGIPRVTGYILAGICAGPQVAGLLSPTVVVEMKVFNTLALALIALEAGLELELGALRRVARTLFSIVAFKIPLAWLGVGGAFMLARGLLPGGDAMPLGTAAALAACLGALSVGTSPAVSVAVISESGVKGKVADLVLGLAVFKDVVMIVMLAIAIAVARVLTTDGATIEPGVFTEVGVKVGASLLAGAALGGLLIAWLRWVRWELVLVIIVLGYAVNQVSELLHLKMLLVFIAAGFVVTNFSKHAEALHKPLSLLALPVFIIFFTTVGAGLDLRAALAVLPLGLVLFAARGAVMFGATRLGAAVADESREFANNLWPGLISQAGVALGLLLVAQEALPELAEPLGQVATVLIGLNLLVGPVLLRRALGWSPDANGTRDAEAGEVDAALPLEGPVDEGLREVMSTVALHLDAFARQVDETVLGPWVDAARARLVTFETAVQSEAQAPLERPTPITLEPAAGKLWEALRDLRNRLDALPVELEAEVLPHHHAPLDAMGAADRLQLRLWRATHPVGRRRRVPVRMAVRMRLEGHVVPVMAELHARLARFEADRLGRQSALRAKVLTLGQPVLGRAVDRERLWIDTAAAALRTKVLSVTSRASANAGHVLRHAGTPAMPRRKLRYQRVAADVDRALGRLAEDGERWDEVLDGVAGRAEIDTRLAVLSARAREASAAAVASWLARQAEVEGIVASIGERLTEVAGQILESPATREGSGARDELSALLQRVERGMVEDLLPRIRGIQGERGIAASLDGIGLAIRALLDDVPESIEATPGLLDLGALDGPEDVDVDGVPLRAVADQYLAAELYWLSDARDAAEHVLNRAIQGLGEMAGVMAHRLSHTLAEIELPELPPARRRVTLRRAARELRQAAAQAGAIHQEMATSAAEVAQSIRTSLADALARVEAQASRPRAGRSIQRQQRLRSAAAWVVSTSKRVGAFAAEGLQTAREFTRETLRIDGAGRRVRSRVDGGLDPHSIAASVDALSVSREQQAAVPYVLAQLFDTRAFDIPQAPVGAATQIATIEAGFGHFVAGRPSAMLVTGAEGSGKTSIVRMTLKRIADRPLVTVAIDALARTEAGFAGAVGAAMDAYEVKSWESVEELLIARRPVLLLDGVEHAFSRTAAGLAHIRRLLRLVTATRQQVCWVIVMAEPTSRLLDEVLGLRSWFTDHVHFPPVDGPTLHEVIQARCRLSGFRVSCPAQRHPGLLAWLWPGRRPNQRRAAFYAELSRRSGGNIRDALALWLNAVDRVEGDTVHLAPIAPVDVSWFDGLGRDAWHVLALAMLSGSLTEGEVAESLRWSRPRALAAIAFLESAHLLVTIRDEGRFRVWPPVWRHVWEQLRRRNLLLAGRAEGAT
ncbi:MAG: cation:proton antiporter [Deltaproteobacteria bacterium]|nr:cation:proton antiporter [Deltaproteobacteria bacterium]